MTIDRETLMAFADGELSYIERARVARAVEADPALAAHVAAHRALKMHLARFFAPVADAPVPERFAALLAHDDRVVAFPQVKAARDVQRWVPRWGVGGAIAASLLIGIGLGTQIPRNDPLVSRNGTMVAQASLARALDTQLAATQGTSPIKMLVSFRDGSGALCRGFSSVTLHGIACRENGVWAVRQVQSGGSQDRGTYRQAGSADAAIMAAAQDMAVGAPLDAAAEARARNSGWKR